MTLTAVLSYSALLVGIILFLAYWTYMLKREIMYRKKLEEREKCHKIILEMIAKSEPLYKVLEAIVLSVEKQNEGAICSIVIIDTQTKKIIKGIAPNLPHSYNEALIGLKMEKGIGSCGTAIETKQRVIVEEIATHPYWKLFKEKAQKAGLGSCWSEPIFSSSKEVIGSFAIYHEVANKPTALDLMWIEQSAYLASIALEKDKIEMQRKIMQAQMEHLAFYDMLTGLPNRSLMKDRLLHSLKASKRSQKYSALMFLDLDDFKALNDIHGHAMGDILLVQAAMRLKENMRAFDTVSRFGGDEFIIILEELDADKMHAKTQVEAVAKKIRLSLSKEYRLQRGDMEKKEEAIAYHCTVSIGIILIHHADNDSYDTLLTKADTAMYKAKEAGKNTIHFDE